MFKNNNNGCLYLSHLPSSLRPQVNGRLNPLRLQGHRQLRQRRRSSSSARDRVVRRRLAVRFLHAAGHRGLGPIPSWRRGRPTLLLVAAPHRRSTLLSSGPGARPPARLKDREGDRLTTKIKKINCCLFLVKY